MTDTSALEGIISELRAMYTSLGAGNVVVDSAVSEQANWMGHLKGGYDTARGDLHWAVTAFPLRSDPEFVQFFKDSQAEYKADLSAYLAYFPVEEDPTGNVREAIGLLRDVGSAFTWNENTDAVNHLLRIYNRSTIAIARLTGQETPHSGGLFVY